MSPETAPSAPTEEELRRPEPIKIHVVDESREVINRAREVAEDLYSADMEGGGRLRQIGKRIWKGNLAREYYLQKYTRQAQTEILESGNLYAHEGTSKSAHDNIVATDVDRFVSEYDGMLDAEEAENRVEISEDRELGVKEIQIRDALKQLVRDYVNGDLTESTFQEEKNRVIDGLAQDNRDLMGRGLMYGDNILEIAHQVQARVEAGEVLESILEQTQIYLDKSSFGVRGEARHSTVDRIVDKIEKSRVGGKFVNDTAVAGAVSIAYTVGNLSFRRVGSVLASVGAVGAPTAIFAGMRERKRMNEERAQVLREAAQGKGEAEDGTRRAELLETVYAAESAVSLRDRIESNLFEFDAEGGRVERDLSSEHIQDVLTRLADVTARRQLGDREKADLISFSDATQVAIERSALYMQVAEAKVVLTRALEAHPELFDDLEVPEGGLDELLRQMAETQSGLLVEGMEDRNRTFNKMRRRAVTKAAVKGALTGAVFGLIAQEVSSLARGGQSSELKALLGHNAPEGSNQTLLRHMLAGSEHSINVAPGNLQDIAVDEAGNQVRIPQGVELVAHKNGSFELKQDHHVLARGLHMQDGEFDAASADKLENAGVHVNTEHISVTRDLPPLTETRELTPADYIDAHKSEMTQVHRGLWYNNDTSAFDRNELKLHWGANKGIDASGNYVFNIAQMSPDGSFSGGLSADAQAELAAGNMRVNLSMTRGTQDHVFSVLVNQNGDAIIEKDSPAAQLFSMENGRAVFHGKYAEAAQVMNVDPNGVENVRMLATYVGKGEGLDKMIETVVTERTETVEQVITTLRPPLEDVESPRVDVPPFVPVYGRRGLERARGAEPAAAPERVGYGMYGRMYGERYGWGAPPPEPSPRLIESPRAVLDTIEELDWYEAEQERIHGTDYVAEIDERIEASEILKRLPVETRLIVSIPVAGAYESENIYKTLQQYAAQDKESLQQTVILLNVNWIEGADQTKVQETLEEIKRAEADYPELKIAYFTKEYSREWVDSRGGRIYGMVIKGLYDTGMFAVQKAIQEGRLESKDVLIVTNDADAQGLSPQYLRNFIIAEERHPEADFMSGFIRWGTPAFADYPGYAFAVTALQAMQFESQRNPASSGDTPGPNSAVRVSALAAIGGVNSDMGEGSDAEMGQRIRALRSATPQRGEGYGAGGSGARGVGLAVPAIVDSAPDRLLGAYMSGKPIVSAWDTFSEGGYTPRTELAIDRPENIEGDFDTIVERIEMQVSNHSQWYGYSDSYERALDGLLPPQDGEALYRIVGDEGDRHFEFTPRGREFLREHLADRAREMTEAYDRRRARLLAGLERDLEVSTAPVPEVESAAPDYGPGRGELSEVQRKLRAEVAERVIAEAPSWVKREASLPTQELDRAISLIRSVETPEDLERELARWEQRGVLFSTEDGEYYGFSSNSDAEEILRAARYAYTDQLGLDAQEKVKEIASRRNQPKQPQITEAELAAANAEKVFERTEFRDATASERERVVSEIWTDLHPEIEKRELSDDLAQRLIARAESGDWRYALDGLYDHGLWRIQERGGKRRFRLDSSSNAQEVMRAVRAASERLLAPEVVEAYSAPSVEPVEAHQVHSRGTARRVERARKRAKIRDKRAEKETLANPSPELTSGIMNDFQQIGSQEDLDLELAFWEDRKRLIRDEDGTLVPANRVGEIILDAATQTRERLWRDSREGRAAQRQAKLREDNLDFTKENIAEAGKKLQVSPESIVNTEQNIDRTMESLGEAVDSARREGAVERVEELRKDDSVLDGIMKLKGFEKVLMVGLQKPKPEEKSPKPRIEGASLILPRTRKWAPYRRLLNDYVIDRMSRDLA